MALLQDLGDTLLGAGKRAVNRLVDKATLGDEYATRLALAEERDDYAGINGSGPYDRMGALTDARKGNKNWWDPFDRSNLKTEEAIMPTWQKFALGAAAALLVVLVVKKL